jgi:hypothetical protein
MFEQGETLHPYTCRLPRWFDRFTTSELIEGFPAQRNKTRLIRGSS